MIQPASTSPVSTPLQPTTRVQTTVSDFSADARETMHQTGNATFGLRMDAEAKKPLEQQSWVGVSEGDSWFDYTPAFLENPFKGDLLAQLHQTGKFQIYNVAKAGDTLENMAYGTDLGNNAQPAACELVATIDAIKLHQPDFFLFSAGGNDLSGSNGVNLEMYLNHASSGLPILRIDEAKDTMMNYNSLAVETVIKKVREAQPNIQIFMHGYDYAMPDGRAVFRAPLGFNFIGPWLLPAFARQRTWPDSVRYGIIRQLIDIHNGMIDSLAQKYDFFHHIDCRGILQQNTSDWANELHPTSSGFGKIAAQFTKVMLGVMEAPAS